MSRRIIDILVKRDGVSEQQASDLVREATIALMEYIDKGDMESAEYVCEEYFGLEPDYIDDLMEMSL